MIKLPCVGTVNTYTNIVNNRFVVDPFLQSSCMTRILVGDEHRRLLQPDGLHLAVFHLSPPHRLLRLQRVLFWSHPHLLLRPCLLNNSANVGAGSVNTYIVINPPLHLLHLLQCLFDYIPTSFVTVSFCFLAAPRIHLRVPVGTGMTDFKAYAALLRIQIRKVTDFASANIRTPLNF